MDVRWLRLQLKHLRTSHLTCLSLNFLVVGLGAGCKKKHPHKIHKFHFKQSWFSHKICRDLEWCSSQWLYWDSQHSTGTQCWSIGILAGNPTWDSAGRGTGENGILVSEVSLRYWFLFTITVDNLRAVSLHSSSHRMLVCWFVSVFAENTWDIWKNSQNLR